MPLRKKIVVQLKVNHHENSIHVIDSLFANTVKPDLVFLDMSTIEYPHRTMEVPRNLVEYVGKHPNVKFMWDENNPLNESEYEKINVEDDERVGCNFIENHLPHDKHE